MTTCFPYFGNAPICDACKAKDRCRSIETSDSFDVAAGAIEMLLEEMPDRIAAAPRSGIAADLVKILLHPPKASAVSPGSTNPDDELLKLIN
jgi:hypothetical protein